MSATRNLGKYEIRRQLGRGAMGVVYEGWDPIIKRTVAIKSVRLPGAYSIETADEIARFRREAEAAGRLIHPNIVGVFDYGETDDVAYIVMEFVDGPTLKALLDRDRSFPLPQIASIMTDLLAGLQYSHERGVVHRDIKPANLMLTPSGQAKIADFGIARIESSSMTQTGVMLGTPAYMSPEQFTGPVVDARSDIYSAGVLLYQFLTGKLPFDGSLSSIMHKTVNLEPPRPSEISVNVSPKLDALVHKALAKNPSDRYATAAVFADAIRAAVVVAGTEETLITPVKSATAATTISAPARPLPVAAPARSVHLPLAPPSPVKTVEPRSSGFQTRMVTAAIAGLVVLGAIGFVLQPHIFSTTDDTVRSMVVETPVAPSRPAPDVVVTTNTTGADIISHDKLPDDAAKLSGSDNSPVSHVEQPRAESHQSAAPSKPGTLPNASASAAGRPVEPRAADVSANVSPSASSTAAPTAQAKVEPEPPRPPPVATAPPTNNPAMPALTSTAPETPKTPLVALTPPASLPPPIALPAPLPAFTGSEAASTPLPPVALATPPIVSLPTPAPPPSPANQVRTMARDVSCAALTVVSNTDEPIFGFASPGPDLDRFLASARDAGVTGDSVTRVDPFACEAITAAARFARATWESNPRPLAVRTVQHEPAAGARFSVAAETRSPFVYIDLYQDDGTVRHLTRPVPGARSSPHNVSAMSPRPGPGLLVAIGSSTTLDLGPRRETEPAADYLALLRQKLDQAKPAPLADMAMITLRPPEPEPPKALPEPAIAKSKPAEPPPAKIHPVEVTTPPHPAALRSARCSSIVSRAQLGETLSNAEIMALRTECRS